MIKAAVNWSRKENRFDDFAEGDNFPKTLRQKNRVGRLVWRVSVCGRFTEGAKMSQVAFESLRY